MTVYVKCNKCGAENKAMIQTGNKEGLASVAMSMNVQECSKCKSHIVVNNTTAYWKD